MRAIVDKHPKELYNPTRESEAFRYMGWRC